MVKGLGFTVLGFRVCRVLWFRVYKFKVPRG
jgi:hypothetical protein